MGRASSWIPSSGGSPRSGPLPDCPRRCSPCRPRPSACWRTRTLPRSLRNRRSNGPRSPAVGSASFPDRAMTGAVHDATVSYPGGLRARWRWGGSGQATEVFALSEVGGELVDLGSLAGPNPDDRCRAELRIERPGGAWTVRLASTINDEPTAQLWDAASQLVVKYGFHGYGLDARSGELRWSHRSATPLLAVFASSRLRHVLLQGELETFAIEADGTVAWRVAHSDVVTDAALVGGRLVLTGYGGGGDAPRPPPRGSRGPARRPPALSMF